MIADLEQRLAEAANQRDHAEQQLDTALDERDRLQEQLAQTDKLVSKHQLRLDQLSKEINDWGPQVEAALNLRGALHQFLGSGALPGGQPTLDMDALVERVVARVGTGGARVFQVVPLEALKHRFQQSAVDRLVQQIQVLDERPRQAILWLLSVDRPARHMEICKRLGFPGAGASFAKFGTGIKEAVAAGFLTTETDGLHVTVRAKVVTELAPYSPTPEDVEATYQHLLAALAQDAQGGAGVGP